MAIVLPQRRPVTSGPARALYRVDLTFAPSVVLEADDVAVDGQQLHLRRRGPMRRSTRTFSLASVARVSRRTVHNGGAIAWDDVELPVQGMAPSA